VLILPKRFKDVNRIINYHDPRSGWHATRLNIFDDYITPVISYGRISLQNIYYTCAEVRALGLPVHPADFHFTIDKNGLRHVPHKDLSDFPLKYSVPGQWDSFYVDLPEGVRSDILPGAKTIITSTRNPQPAETERILQWFKKHKDSPGCLPKPPAEIGHYKPGKIAKRKSYQVPAKIGHKPRKPKPIADATIEPARRSVGREISLAWIEPVFWERMEADGLRMNEIEVFRILHTFRKYPETRHWRSPGKGSLGALCYTITGQSQISQMLVKVRRDIRKSGNPERREQAKRMGTSIKSVKRAIKKLGMLGYHFVIYYGYPQTMERISPEKQALREQRNETVPQSGPSKYAIATNKAQQKYFKKYDRICRDRKVRPCLMNLQKILGKSISL